MNHHRGRSTDRRLVQDLRIGIDRTAALFWTMVVVRVVGSRRIAELLVVSVVDRLMIAVVGRVVSERCFAVKGVVAGVAVWPASGRLAVNSGPVGHGVRLDFVDRLVPTIVPTIVLTIVVR